MAEPILVMGKSGTGKTSSLRNLPPKETFIIKPNNKSLAFPGSDKNYTPGENVISTSELDQVQAAIRHISDNLPNVKYIVLEDFTHFFSARIFSKKFLNRTIGGEAFQRWNDFGASVFSAIFATSYVDEHGREVEYTLRDDLYIIILHHTEVKEDGSVGFKSAGKLLDNTIDFPSYFTWIFHSIVTEKDDKSSYEFQTNRAVGRHAKSPYGVFPLFVPNDLAAILNRLDAYKAGEIEIKW